MIRAISRLMAMSVTIFVIWHEFPELSTDPEFLVLLMTWGLYVIIVFWLDYRQAKEKPTGEKLDELIVKMDEFITEMRNKKGNGENGK